MGKNIGFVLVCFNAIFLTSCGTTYFVDPVSTPVFTAPGQGDIQGSLAIHNKFFLEGAYALPYDYALVLTRENFAHGLDNDQSMTSFAFGHFWPNRDSSSSFQVLAGFGTGSHRIGPNAYYKPYPGSFARAPRATSTNTPADTTPSYPLEWLLIGNSDFRKYFVQAQWALRGANGTFGFAVRLYYLDQYNYLLASKVIASTNNSDSSLTVDIAPKNGVSLDVAVFGSIGISFFELYALMQLSFPPTGSYFPNGNGLSLDGLSDTRNWDVGALSVGVKVKF